MANFLNNHSLKSVTLILVLSFSLGLSLPAKAQEEGPASEAVTTAPTASENTSPSTATSGNAKKKKTKNVKLDFSEEMVEGNSDKPYEMMLMKRPDQKFKKILKFREDFHNNMESSFDDVR